MAPKRPSTRGAPGSAGGGGKKKVGGGGGGQSEPAIARNVAKVQTIEANVEYHGKLTKAWETLMGHPKCSELQSLDALPLVQATMDDEKYNEAMANEDPLSRVYRCAGNAGWCYKGCSELGKVNESKVSKWGSLYYSTAQQVMPQHMNYNFIVAVLPTENPRAIRGQMILVSPAEPLDALVFAAAKRVEGGADDDEMEMWMNMFRTASFQFVAYNNTDDLKWLRVQNRETIGTQFELLFRSPLERAFEIICIMKELCGNEDDNPSNVAALVAEWKVKVKSSGMGDEINEGLVQAVFVVNKRLLRCHNHAYINMHLYNNLKPTRYNQ